MAEYDYSYDYTDPWSQPYDNWSGGGDVFAGGSPTFNEGGNDYFNSPAFQTFIGGGTPYGPGSSGDVGFTEPSEGGGFGGWLRNLLLGAGGAAAGAAGGGGGGIAGPLLSSLGALGGGAIGSNAANEAARLQSHALNRGIDLQTAQWLQQQQNLAPYLQAGQQGLSTLQGLAGREQPALPGVPGMLYGDQYAMPNPTPGWTPQHIDANAYRWTPGQGPQAQDYRYTPGNIPQAANYRYTPGAVPTLSGKELLANDPGVQFRMDEGRKALEASAAARGGLLSGPTLAALQRQGQELSSQEYGQAWNRASQQAQLREQWGQAASQMGWGQAEAEARLREQVNQVASQQGWSQAQAEAVFREQMAQQASQQGFNQHLAGQQWNVGQHQRYETDLYTRQAQQAQQRYGQDLTAQNTAYDRQQQQYRQQLAQHLLPWEQQSALASLGGSAVGMYGQQGQAASNAMAHLLGSLGTAQGTGAAGQGLAWTRALGGATNQLPSILSGLNA